VRETPADLYLGLEDRRDRHARETTDPHEGGVLSSLDGEEAPALGAPSVLQTGETRGGLLDSHRTLQETHDARVCVHLCERTQVLFPPLTEAQARGEKFRHSTRVGRISPHQSRLPATCCAERGRFRARGPTVISWRIRDHVAKFRRVQPPSTVVSYNTSWPAEFELVAAFLRPVLPAGVQIEHVGSTSVPGLAAKAIIDVDLVVAAEVDVAGVIQAVSALGFVHRGDGGIPGREAFNTLGSLPYHHVYVVVAGSEAHRDHIDLREYLRRHPDQARGYAAEKRRLEHLLLTDREAYVVGKGPFITELLRRARSEHGSRHEHG
jgi:GrpB-like predicted nucleotidyltransferase (UPF0157 family)